MNKPLVYGTAVQCFENEVPENGTVGYLLGHRSLLLYGERLSRRVLFVGNPQSSATEWLRTLREQRVSVVVVGPVRPEWQSRSELQWLADEANFTLMCGHQAISEPAVYRVGS